MTTNAYVMSTIRRIPDSEKNMNTTTWYKEIIHGMEITWLKSAVTEEKNPKLQAFLLFSKF